MKKLLSAVLVLFFISVNIVEGQKKQAQCGFNSDTYTRNGNFTVPMGIKFLRVIVVGGGGGGTNGHQSGGAGGYVKCAILRVPSCEIVPITVGGGGRAGKGQANSDEIDDCTAGNPSSFGNYLVAAGGGACNPVIGNAGGTGSGAPCLAHSGGRCTVKGSRGGAGGSAGSNGGSATDGSKGGAGQGADYLKCLQMAKVDELTPGAGGEAGEANCELRSNQCWGAGGGGGGVLVNGKGPDAYDGRADDPKYSGKGGKGHGAGGGGGGIQRSGDYVYRYAGGNGEDGLVHIEWEY